VHYCRYTHGQTEPSAVVTRSFVYELSGNVAHPGIYRFREKQTTQALSAACCAGQASASGPGNPVSSGTRLMFTDTGIVTDRMDAASLLSYHMPISLSDSSAEDLELIPGIGPKTARAICEYRIRSGRIQSIDQLLNIKGIGPKTLEKIERYLSP
jgi:competence ComEA-like helix-hairpin-helix protein